MVSMTSAKFLNPREVLPKSFWPLFEGEVEG
jgi:hypothetical protein